MKNKTEMKSLLRTILEEAKRNKVMFRYCAYELWNWNCPEYIVEWGYDIDQVIETLEGIDGDGRIEFIQAKFVEKECKYTLKYSRLFNDISENWGGYENDDCDFDFIKKNKDKITYACDPQNSHYNITIGEGSEYCVINETEATEFLLNGDAWIRWELWNTGVECLSDYTVNLDEWINISKISEDWDEKHTKFQKGLL